MNLVSVSETNLIGRTYIIQVGKCIANIQKELQRISRAETIDHLHVENVDISW